MPIIPADGLERLRNYKYISGGMSPIDKWLNQYIWNPAVNLVPIWMAPNLVTMSGLTMLIISFLVMAQLTPTMSEPAPSWWYLILAFLQFMYQTLDAVDGKQSRRTVPVSSSPLGQLFDHGCDSMSTFLSVLPVTTALRMGYGPWTVICLIAVQGPFFMSQWEEHYTHVLRTFVGAGLGVSEGQLTLMLLLLISAIFGTDFWLTETSVFLPEFLVDALKVVRVKRLNSFIGFVLVVVNINMCASNVRMVFKTVKDNHLRRRAVRALIPLVTLLLCAFAWEFSLAFHLHPWICLTTLGILFSHITTQMIIASVSRTSFSIWQPSLYPLVVVVINSYMTKPVIPHSTAIYLYFAYVMFSILRFLVTVIEEIASYLGIYVFTLGHRANWQPPPGDAAALAWHNATKARAAGMVF